jgi:iron complex outermembrane recepter protein
VSSEPLEGYMSESRKSADKKAGMTSAAALTTATALLGFATGASAQDATTDAVPEGAEAVEEVVVTGFRASLDKALDAKQEQVGAIDMIVAEDIADFPDLNLAESLQRVPGVVIARDAGEGRQISVRGLGPQFTRVRINGIEAMSANGGTDAQGGTNRARNFDFNTFASELFNNITIRKTASSDVEEGSLGATVDLRTGRPFDYDGFVIAGGLQLGYNDLNEETDPRATFLVSNTFADGKLGALFSLAYSDRKLSDDGASTVRWQNGLGANAAFGAHDPSYTGSITPAQLNAAFRPRIPRYDKYNHEQSRLGVTAALQFAPSDSTAINLDLLYAKFEAERDEIFLESFVFSTNNAGGIGDVNLLDGEIDDTNTLVYGRFNDVDVRSEARYDELTTDFYQATVSAEHTFSETFKIGGTVGFAEANHENPIQTTLLFDALNVDGYTYDYRENSRLPLITYGGIAVESNAPIGSGGVWGLTQIRLRPQSTLNSFQTASLDLEWTQSESFGLTFGPQWKNYIFKSTELRRSNGTTGNIETVIPVAAMGTPIANYSTLTRFGDGLDLPAGAVTTWLSPDVRTAIGELDLNNRTLFPLGIQPALGNNNEVEETDLGAYVQGNFSFDLGGHTLRGNLGVRYVETTQESSGFSFVGGVPQYVTVENEYDDTLPSLNLVYDFSDSLLMRFGASKVMTRPNLGQITPGAAISASSTIRTVTVGNPALEPFRADAYDLGVEWYFAPESLLSLAIFYKDISTFVQTSRESMPFTGNPFGLPDTLANAACGTQCTAADTFQFTFPLNTPGGPLKGFEVSYQQPFTFLPGVWSNFGTILNYTGVESEIVYLTTGQPSIKDDLTGLSKDAFNATLYFDNKTFSARVSAAYRSDYLTTIPGRDGNDVEGTASTMNIDFSTTYNINDNFAVSLEALNLTDEVQDQWVDSIGNRLSYYHHQGRQFYVGGRFKF